MCLLFWTLLRTHKHILFLQFPETSSVPYNFSSRLMSENISSPQTALTSVGPPNNAQSQSTETQSTKETNMNVLQDNQTADTKFDDSSDRPAQQTPVAVVPNWMQQENFLACLEANVREYTQSLRTLLQKLKTSLHETTALSVQYMKVYKTTVDNVNDAVNQNAIVMHQLITKTQQLNEDLKQLQFLAQQIKNVKKDLSAFEKLVENLTKR